MRGQSLIIDHVGGRNFAKFECDILVECYAGVGPQQLSLAAARETRQLLECWTLPCRQTFEAWKEAQSSRSAEKQERIAAKHSVE